MIKLASSVICKFWQMFLLTSEGEKFSDWSEHFKKMNGLQFYIFTNRETTVGEWFLADHYK